MDNIIDLNFPNPKTVSSVSMKEPPVGAVASDNYLNRTRNYGIAPAHSVRALSAINTTLSPSPRNNIDADPACTTCRNYPDRPFKRDNCYMIYSPEQNIWGPVCGDGGSNANWNRGNRFGDSYEYSKVFNRDPYDINTPKFIKQNPTIIMDSPFYKFPDFDARFDRKYKSFPYENNYTEDGKPTYVYPYDNAGIVVKEGFGNMVVDAQDIQYQQSIDMLIAMLIILGVIYIYNKF